MTAFFAHGLNLHHRISKTLVTLVFLVACFFSLPFSGALSATGNPDQVANSDFPIYPSLKVNVDFWVNVFSKYSKFQGVIHDTKNLAVVYEVVQLDATNTANARKRNKAIKKAVNKKYKALLLNLADKKQPTSKDEQRLVELFGPAATSSTFKAAASRIRCQTGLKKQFKDGLIRSGAVIDEFRRIFRSHGLPVDLVYLPCVESSYNFKAYSKFGAAGIWQFTHATGRQYMKINYVVDERRDPYISTDAAARLLKKNFARTGEWPMAITAYNHGLAGMMRAKKARGSHENIINSYHSRSFKFASRNFYAEFLAARKVAKNAGHYFGQIKVHQPLQFQVIQTKGYLPVAALSETLKIRIQEIQRLNPSLRPPVFKEQKYIPKGFLLRLPQTLALKNLSHDLSAVYHDRQKPSRFHRVQRGDTAGSISRLHSVKLKDLIIANNLNPRSTIYIGQNLRIPVNNGIRLARQTFPEKTAPKTITPEKKIKPLEIFQETEAKPIKDVSSINPDIVTGNLKIIQTYPDKQNQTIGMIRVEAEETLGHYADWLQIPTQKIRALNKLKYGMPISIDQTIKLPLGKKNVRKFEEQRYDFHKEIEEDFFESFSISEVAVYTVKNGDTIWSLCLNELEIPFWLLRKYNPTMRFTSLYPLEKIKYPLVNPIKED